MIQELMRRQIRFEAAAAVVAFHILSHVSREIRCRLAAVELFGLAQAGGKEAVEAGQ
jgi:hypothetical protein